MKADEGATVTAKCVGCGNRRKIPAASFSSGGHPCCERCGMPMVAMLAERER